jgi:hypothetical protein
VSSKAVRPSLSVNANPARVLHLPAVGLVMSH